MAVTQQPILSRLDRLDNLMRHLENLRGSNRSLKSSSPSTPSSGTRTSDVEFFSPRSLDKLHCRPIDDVIVETEHKGTLLDRVSLIEHRLLKLEEEMESEKQEKDRLEKSSSHSHKKVGLKQFVKSCVKGSKNKSNHK